MAQRTRIMGTMWVKWPDGLYRGPSGGNGARVASSLGGAVECELALQHAERRGLSLPCNPGHIWKDTGMPTSSAATVY